MTKEQESRKQTEEAKFESVATENAKVRYGYVNEYYIEGYIDGAETREKRIEELEKENADLKERCNILGKGCETCTKFDEVQLIKAKKIIKSLLLLWEDVMTEDTVKSMINEAEQFLKEAEQ